MSRGALARGTQDDILDGWTIVRADPLEPALLEPSVPASVAEGDGEGDRKAGLPTCGVTEAEGATLLREVDALGLAGPHSGLLLLGTVREMLSTPGRDEEMRDHFLEVLRWRAQHGADTIVQTNVPEKQAMLHVPSYCFGATRAGLPVLVEKATDWQRALAAAAEEGIAAEVFGRCRLRCSERYLQFVRAAHARGQGNGQYVMIIDCAGFSMGFYEGRAAMSYAKVAVSVAMTYAGICRTVYVANGSRMVSMLWKLLQPLLPETTKRKFVVLPAVAPSVTSFGAAGSLTEMVGASLPQFLGGTVDEPIAVLSS